MNKRIKIIIAVACLLLLWAAFSVRVVRAGRKQIVSAETVKIDTTTKEIRVVSPDEIQRLEDDRDRAMKVLEDEIALLEIRLSKLESEVYK